MSGLLVLAETDGAKVAASTAHAITLAQEIAGATGVGFDLLLCGGPEVGAQAEAWRGYGAARVFVAASPALAHPTADRVAAVCALVMRQAQAESLVGVASSFGRDVLPRVAGLLDLPMLSDVMQVTHAGGRLSFQRPMYAGNIVATVQVEGDQGVFSARSTAFGKPTEAGGASEVQAVEVDASALPQDTTWISLEAGEQSRPDLSIASVIVSGGLPLRDAATFEKLIGGLADKLGGAVGATRAAVDGGIAPNELQIGQTGRVVAPPLYIAAGISGSVQHMAGMKDSKVIVAINTNPDAPIFDIADYGLVADLHTAIPELMAKL